MRQKIVEQDTKLATLESEIASLKKLLSSQNKPKRISKTTDSKSKSSQIIAKGLDNQKQEGDLFSDLQLAKILGVTQTTVNRWRTGQRKPSKNYSNLFDFYEVVGKKWRRKT